MKQWIKLETCLLLDERIKKLLVDHGLNGLGLYVILRNTIESTIEKTATMLQLLVAGAPYARRNKILKIISDYDLFTQDADANISFQPLSPAHTPAYEPAQASAQAPADRPADEPIDNENRIEKKIYKKGSETETETDWRRGFALHYPNLAYMKEPLTEAQYHKLLDKYTNQQIKYKLEQLDNIYNVAIKYTSTYRVLNNWLKRDNNRHR